MTNTAPSNDETRLALSPAAHACLQDLEALAPFLLANDAGAQQPPTAAERVAREAALELARREAAAVQDEAQGTAVLQAYLRAWRAGHLAVHSLNGDGGSRSLPPASMPSIRMLSAATALIVLPTFLAAAREPLAALIERHREDLEARPNWIVDVRGNGGGSDLTYVPLLPWLVPDGWMDVSERVYVTPANREAEERIAQELAPGDAETARIVQAIVERMRAAGDGTWVQQQYAQGWQHQRPERIERAGPQRVAVLMDSGCGSSCEQFLLTVRQSFAVKLVGRSRSAGWLDASNMRPHLLPSGRRRLWYATTLSNRLPGLPIDGIGVEPDVLLPYPHDDADRSDDVGRTQHWLEHGAWASPQEGARSKRESR